ncbi:ankyrin repeat protein [Apiospora arundinis]|uniref:Ankyrin repeat protein n=1 Tax=Apiospora arundinis TaxID=335852 RepID=A0ABR2JGV6_9PEZI
MKLGKLCPLFADYQALYPGLVGLQKALVDFHASIIRCCAHLIKTLQRPLHHQLLKSLLVSFEQEFKPDLDETWRYSNLVEKEIHLAKAQADRQDQHLQAVERQEASKGRTLIGRFTGRADDALRKLHQMQLQRDERAARERKQRLLDSLSTRDYLRLYKQNCRKRWQDTASWIFQMPDFQKWLLGESPVLWCSGRIGSGKTITTASVIQHVLRRKGPIEGPVSYFFEQSNGAGSVSTNEVLKSILRQRLDPTNISENVEIALRSLDVSSDLDDILDILRQSIPPGASYIMIDGIDECHQSDRRELLTALSSLISSNDSIRLFLSGRTGIQDEVKACFKQVSHIILDSEATRHDITQYIEGVIDYKVEIGELRVGDSNLVGEIKSALAEGAQGMYTTPYILLQCYFLIDQCPRFLWAYLQVKEITSKPSDEDIRIALINLPKDLNGIFNRALQRIRAGTHAKESQKVFTWIKAAVRPLTLEQIREAIAIQATQQFSEPSRHCNDMDKIALWCENLVEAEEESQCVQFVHHSVRTFLLGISTDDTLASFHLNMDEANHKLGEICLTYLNFNDFKRALITRPTRPKPLAIRNPIGIVNATAKPGSRLATIYQKVIKPRSEAFDLRRSIDVGESTTTTEISQTLTDEYPLLGYVAEHWIYHTKLVRRSDSRTWKILEYAISFKLQIAKLPWSSGSQSNDYALRWAKKHHHYAIIRLLWSDTHVEMMKWADDHDDLAFFDMLFKEMGEADYNRRSDVLVYAASLGHLEAVNEMERRRKATEKNHSERAKAMVGAARRGHINVIETLIDWGVDTDIQLNMKITPLEAAAGNGQLEVVDRLLLQQAKVNFWNSLAEAAARGCVSVVERLLQSGANVEGRAAIAESPLTRAIKGGHREVVDILLAVGANVNSGVVEGRHYPLLAATLGGHVEILDNLLDAGADDIRAQVPAFLQVKPTDTKQMILHRKLLEHEVKLSEIAARPRTMLHVAAKLGRAEHAFALLKAGIRVDAVDETGSTALLFAIRAGSSSTVRTLLEAGADANVVDESGSSLLLVAMQNKADSSIIEALLEAGADASVIDESGSGLLLMAVRHKADLSIIKALLKAGTNSEAMNMDKDMALYVAVRDESLSIVETLLKAGIKTNIVDRDGNTLLHIAASYNTNPSVADALIRAGVRVDAVNKSGSNPLHVAAAGLWPLVVRRLCDTGSDVLNATDGNGNTALHIAARGGRWNVAKAVFGTYGINKEIENSRGETARKVAKDSNDWPVWVLHNF